MTLGQADFEDFVAVTNYVFDPALEAQLPAYLAILKEDTPVNKKPGRKQTTGIIRNNELELLASYCLLRADLANPQCYFRVANILLLMGKEVEALAAIEWLMQRGLNFENQWPRPEHYRPVCLIANRRFSEAKGALGRWILGGRQEFALLLGLCFHGEGRFEDACHWYDEFSLFLKNFKDVPEFLLVSAKYLYHIAKAGSEYDLDVKTLAVYFQLILDCSD
jgi:tetratricopeptide (TPR) repeat protein